MQDQDKTQAQLIAELTELRQRVAELETAEAERKRAEEALPESEARYRQLVELSQDLIVIHQQGKVVFINEAGVRLVGASSPDQIVGRSVFEFVPFLRREIAQERARRLPAEGKSPVYEQKLLRLNGTEVDIEVVGISFRYQGEIAVQLVARDITERKQVEEALRASEEKYRSLVENLNDVIYTLDEQGRFSFVSPVIRQISQYDPADMVGRHFADFVHPDDVPGLLDSYARTLAGRIEPFEVRVRDKDGSIHTVRTSSRLILSEGKPVELLAVMTDITERKQAEEALRESEEKYRALMNNASDAILLADAEGNLLESNQKAQELLGYTSEELRSMNIVQIHPPEETERTLAVFRDIVQRGPGSLRDGWVMRKDGQRVAVDITGSVVEYAGKQVVQGIFRDITERKQVEEEHQAHLRFFQSMDQVNRAMQGTHDLEKMMSDVLETMLSIFDCDRSWLLYPCDPDAPSFRVPMEVTKPEYPGAKILNVNVPMSPGEAQNMREALESDAPVTYTAGTERPISTAKQFGVQSQVFVPVYPKLGKPWVFGMHQCSYPRVWTQEDKRLFQEIGRRLEDALSSLLAYRDLRESEEKYRAIIEQSAEGVALIDESGNIVEWNQANERMTGLRRNEVIGLPLWDIAMLTIAPERQTTLRRDALRSAVLEALQTGKSHLFAGPIEAEFYPRPGKEKHYLHQTIFPIKTDRGYRIASLTHDITERKQAEQALRESEEKWRSLVSTLPDYVSLLDREGRFLFLNHYAEGFTEKDIIGSSVYQYLSTESKEIFEKKIAECQNTGKIQKFEHTAMGNHGIMRESCNV